MARFKKNIVEEAKRKNQEAKEQERLKEKYNIGQDVVVVEKSNTYKFTVKMLVNLIRTILTVILLVLAVIGLISLLYPAVRNQLLIVLSDVYNELKMMIR